MFQVLLDAPSEPKTRIQIARLGPVKDARYGEFEITEDNVANWQTNLSHLPGQRALIDFEHRSERKPRDSQAAGWITGIDLEGDKVMADTEWTDTGQDAIANRRYLFLSPAYGPHSTEDGSVYDDTLCSVALTNKPVLGSLPMLTLASDERVSEALESDSAARFYTRALDGDLGAETQALVTLDVSQADRDTAKQNHNSLPDGSYPINNSKQLHAAAVLAASKHGDWQAAQTLIRRRAKELSVDITTLPGFASESADSPRSMATEPATTPESLIKLLDLPDDADEAAVEEAVKTLQTKATEEKDVVKSLEQQATEKGLMVLDAKAVDELTRKATAGETAMKALHAQQFETAFKDALAARKVAPAEKEGLKHFYELDSDATLKLLDDREPIVPEKPAGAPAIDLTQDDLDPQDAIRAGVVPDSVTLDQQIRKHMTEKGLPESDYPRLLDQYMTNGRLL